MRARDRSSPSVAPTQGDEGMRRRSFLAGGVAIGLGASGALSGPATADIPKKGGHLRVGLAGGGTTDSIDPATHTDTFMQMLCMGMAYNCLTEVTADGDFVGELAESWEASADAKVWTFKLRTGVQFHDGKSFGAEDVIASLRHHLGEQSKSAAKPIVSVIDEMTEIDKHTVSFSLKGGNADFPYLLSDYHLIILPAGGFEESFKRGNGTGGYIIESFEPGVRAITRRNPNYFKSDRAHFDSVELIGIADVNARQTALTTGEVDVINRVDLKTVRRLRKLPGVEVFEVTGNQHYTFPMLTNAAPYDNNHVRLALKYAIDREEMVKKILHGHGLIGNDHPIGPANQHWANGLPQRTYDPDKAKFHLKKADLSSLSLQLSAADAAFPGAVDAAALYRENAAAAGINIDITREPNDGYWSNIWMKKPWCACYWSGRATEDWMFSTAYEAGVPWNDTFWNHEKFNALLIEARAELDTDRRRDMYRDLQTIVRDEGGVVIPMFANYVDAASSKLAHGLSLGNNWQLDGVRLAERWWFA